MNLLSRLVLSATALAAVGLLEPHDGMLAIRSWAELTAALGLKLGTLAEPGLQLAQLGSTFASQRPSHEVLELAVQAFGYPVNSGLNLALTVVGMLIVGVGVMTRCRRD